MNWYKKNRVISMTFVMSGIFCVTLTMLGTNVGWTGAIFFLLGAIAYWFAMLTK